LLPPGGVPPHNKPGPMPDALENAFSGGKQISATENPGNRLGELTGNGRN